MVAGHPALQGHVQVLPGAAALHVHLELVLSGEGLVAGGAGVGPLPGVQELVPVDVLRPREFLAADVAGVLVVGLGAVRLEVLGQLARLVELLAALDAGVDPGVEVVDGEVGVLLLAVADQPALRCERLVAALNI